MRRLETLDDLNAIYGPASPVALRKVANHLTPLYRRWIEHSRFCVISTVGPNGTHCSPRGEFGPVVRVTDPNTILLPDWSGNNRLDALRDIIVDPQVAFLFMIPRSRTTIRVNGQAYLTDDAALRASFERKGRQPATVVVTEIAEVYSQCAKAIMRSDLWSGADVPDSLPSFGAMLAEMTEGDVNGAEYDSTYEQRYIPKL